MQSAMLSNMATSLSLGLELLQTSLCSSNDLFFVPNARNAGVLNHLGRPLVKVGGLGGKLLDDAVRHDAVFGQRKQSQQKRTSKGLFMWSA